MNPELSKQNPRGIVRKARKVSQRYQEVNWEERIKYFLVPAPGIPLRNSSAVALGER
jgi:hypothetical protein